MKITMYELLGLVKDGKAPKKIMYNNIVWEYVNHKQDYRSRHNAELFFNDEINNTWIMTHLNTQIEILKEEKKLPEKLDVLVEVMSSDKIGVLTNEIGEIQRRFNQLLDYLKSKGDE